ncbi:hypothetical protein, partial [Vibrio cidicii]|uniref:hypothetical protein n=1 Tax=Vibrio cidicii TaxID=1763883 RepID=UPI0037037D93
GRIRTIEGGAGRFTVCSLWPLGNPSRVFFFSLAEKLKRRFPNASLKCGAHHNKPFVTVKPFSGVFGLNASFLDKVARKYSF